MNSLRLGPAVGRSRLGQRIWWSSPSDLVLSGPGSGGRLPDLRGQLPQRVKKRRKRAYVAGTQVADGIINPPIDELLDVVDSKYRLVIMAAKRARQINAYYSQLGEGLLEYVGPLVDTRSQEKPLSISLREIKERLLNVEVLEGS
jgi:DNA-directed RNA polymerase subunit omega